ncbi:hypothetical protein [Aliihoeflea sp. 40Bstr573]|nr:hypothetical protein [Aliihoeflea sp. 40Bstr573]MCO6386240.1 hypothetical protein [Aliihoeflea sp. 40Bstr573]
MNVANVGDLSLGQWAARVRGWNRAHGSEENKAPSESEFDLAVEKAMGSA